jgi:hypothetical protein
MKIKNIIQDCTLGITLYATNNNIKDFISYLIYNKTIIEQFPNMVIAINSDEEDLSFIKELLSMYIEEVDLIFLDQNRGHMFGTMDLDEAVLNASKSYPQKYLLKISQDVILESYLEEVDIEKNQDFYFLPGFSYETVQRNVDASTLYNIFDKGKGDDFTPQSNFFIVNKEIFSSIYGDKNIINNLYLQFQEILKTKPNAKCWEEFTNPKFDCETYLGNNVKLLTTNIQSLLSKEEFNFLWEYIDSYKVGDPSHKNIMLPCGICHFQWKNQPITKLAKT